MTIEMFDKSTILVTMCEEDMRLFQLDFTAKTPRSVELGLKNLLYRVGAACGIDYHGKSYLIEALPSKTGCLLIITVRTVRRRRIYRIKRSRAREVCVFFDADAMLDYRERADDWEAGEVYRFRGKYILLPPLNATEKTLSLLSEYGALKPLSPTAQARVREHGAPLHKL